MQSSDIDARALFVLFEPELTLAMLPVWWIEVPSIRALGRTYRGVSTDDLIFFNWYISRNGSVLSVEFFGPSDLSADHANGFREAVGPLAYINGGQGIDENKPPFFVECWFTDCESDDVDHDASILQDFSAALYLVEPSHWAIALNIDWLPQTKRDSLIGIQARWIEAECDLVEPGRGVSLCKGFTADGLYGLRRWFWSTEGPSEPSPRRRRGLPRFVLDLWNGLVRRFSRRDQHQA